MSRSSLVRLLDLAVIIGDVDLTNFPFALVAL